ncbi:TerB N-terminal domain-containing protein [Janthinobacterium rivuli]|uniref:TerB N-terminal domain-containing protein n=1 Tax=Janthinobacterium rivuli TaxID=2751478 RepID=A0ABY8I0D9_9BURK|nr:TerB N-terminal domain-containing protein [Janthinobacterium rivuli]WFR78333.1 TerB N-terminal domain-containing protein [Janthinobacterium rivuli]
MFFNVLLAFAAYHLMSPALLLSLIAGALYVGCRYRARTLKLRRSPPPELLSCFVPPPAKAAVSSTASLPVASIVSDFVPPASTYQDKTSEVLLADPSGYRIPPPPPLHTPVAQWIGRHESVEIGGLLISGGMIYVGQSLPGNNGKVDPALIDPGKSVDFGSDYATPVNFYWSSYSDALPQQRGAYLRWLADGRSSPDADIAYVFAFFYGLERRVLIDAENHRAIDVEIPQIIKELTRLHKHYGGKSGLFSRHCMSLLEVLQLASNPERLYLQPIPDLSPEDGMPLHLRVALGQACRDKTLLTVDMAWAWVRYDPALILRTAASRCPEEFESLFRLTYRRLHGDGIALVSTSHKLCLPYSPASPGLKDGAGRSVVLGDIPDLTVASAPQQMLQKLIDTCSAELDAYSRFIEHRPDRRTTLDAWVLLPYSLWPEAAKQALCYVNASLGEAVLVMSVNELARHFGASDGIGKDSLRALAAALLAQQIAMEPDILSMAGNAALTERVALYRVVASDEAGDGAPFYDTALLSLELLIAMAQSEGVYSDHKWPICQAQITTWRQLTPHQQQRLMARLILLQPVSLSSFKRRIAALPLTARDACADCIITMVGAPATRQEIAVLEKVCTLLGVEHEKMYSQVHAAATAHPPANGSSVSSGGFVLDLARIAALQKDSQQVATLLGDIFQDEATSEVTLPPLDSQDGLLGLDAMHAAFSRHLLSRASWRRSKLEPVAHDAGVMLDGALERLNEACFDAFDMPCTEGDDPIDINPDILERLAQ